MGKVHKEMILVEGEYNWIQERLDRSLANHEWQQMFLSAEVQVLEVATSDHLPLYLHLNKRIYVHKQQRFHFENMWLREQDCRNVVCDKNTRFFHSYASGRRRNNKVDRIKDAYGNWRDTPTEIRKGRLLTDNALIAFEINHYMKRRTQGNNGVACLKLDISKAYDRLEWAFIRNRLERFGFHHVRVHRIMSFICSVSYNFLHNGEQFRYVMPGRGVRQGDPISPYICIMCTEGLSSIIRRSEEVGLIHRCRIAK
ncbi:hypothetical protein DCAR_0936205 [Daucus carota subsp. sativus]|uniref:Reverse transcriptase domain-containing protein n=1 Tax=Daucus carota subsp. sativus TaxID=79200 RepID=A0AAF0Y179_DAUCS|nr:hypothetical protein DCAR_0936205 [Daucus carota subsp. sativus]